MDLSKFSSHFEISSEEIDISSLSAKNLPSKSGQSEVAGSGQRLAICFSGTSITMKPSRALSSPGHKAFLCLSFPDYRKRVLVSKTFHELQRSNMFQSGRGAKAETSPRNSNAALGQGHT